MNFTLLQATRLPGLPRAALAEAWVLAGRQTNRLEKFFSRLRLNKKYEIRIDNAQAAVGVVSAGPRERLVVGCDTELGSTPHRTAS